MKNQIGVQDNQKDKLIVFIIKYYYLAKVIWKDLFQDMDDSDGRTGEIANSCLYIERYTI